MPIICQSSMNWRAGAVCFLSGMKWILCKKYNSLRLRCLFFLSPFEWIFGFISNAQIVSSAARSKQSVSQHFFVFTSLRFTSLHFTALHFLLCSQSTFTSRTSGHWLVTLGAVTLSVYSHVITVMAVTNSIPSASHSGRVLEDYLDVTTSVVITVNLSAGEMRNFGPLKLYE